MRHQHLATLKEGARIGHADMLGRAVAARYYCPRRCGNKRYQV
jgi:hypothetical protein